MAEAGTAGNRIAALRNVGLLVQLHQRLTGRRQGLPGIGVFHGFHGYGKSTSLAHLGIHHQAVVVQVKELWSASNALDALLAECGVTVTGNIGVKADAVAAHLAQRQRALVFDDAQYMLKKRYIGVARDIHEASGAPVILVGEEMLPQALQAWPNIASRVLDWVPAQPATARDAALLAPIYMPGVEPAADLLEALVAKCSGNTRLVCNNLSLIGERAKVRGAAAVALADEDLSRAYTGQPPDIRHSSDPWAQPVLQRQARQAAGRAGGGHK